MKILIDTNILIYAEDPNELSLDIQKLFQLINAINAEIYYHQASTDDLNEDKDEKRKMGTISKLSKYKSMPIQQDFSKDVLFLSKIGKIRNRNDQTDAQLLFSVYNNSVDYLITNDQNLTKRAAKIECEERVFDISDANNLFGGILAKESKIPKPIAISKIPMKNIDCSQTIFNSLREDYPKFDEWFNKKASEGRKAFVHFTDSDRIDAILVLKEEHCSIQLINKILPPKRRLKICLLKSKLNHTNMGELFIKLAVTTAITQDIDEIYLTHFIKDLDYLVPSIEKFGFDEIGKKQSTNGPEAVFTKPLIGEAIVPFNKQGISEFNKKYYPSFYDGKNVKKYIIPIRPQYYQRLFTESKSRQTLITEVSGNFAVEGNAIRKAYLCNSKTKTVAKEDVLVFYLSEKSQAMLVGTVEKIKRETNPEEIMKIIARRTVYTKKEIAKLCSKGVLVILFKWNFNFPTPLNLTLLKKEGILKAAPQSIMELPHERYIKLKSLSKLDQKYTVSNP